MKLPVAILAVIASISATVDATVYFKEQFLDGDGWTSRWTESKHKTDYGQWKLTAGKFYGDAEADKGPDICGYSTKKVHVIFNYKGQNHLIKKDIKCKDDEMTHLYTLILNPDQTYEVKINNEKVESGTLEEDWDMRPPKKIKDPEAKKPSDWDDRAMIDDPSDTKPEEWDKPETILDPDAKKPDDWDVDMDGEWEPPMITNPEYKGEWKPKQIANSNYKGAWVHPEIDNPEYTEDATIYKFDNIGVLGLDLWQVKSGTIFDNFLITDDVKEAEEFGKETWGATTGPEKKMKEAQEDMERKIREEEEEKAKSTSKETEGDEEAEGEEDDDEAEEEGEETDEDAETEERGPQEPEDRVVEERSRLTDCCVLLNQRRENQRKPCGLWPLIQQPFIQV
uniref:Calreticulin n=1 Tax=Gasterosteus aculeatus aculeatus TaxID=481459 RepID=G3NFC9_GASAC